MKTYMIIDKETSKVEMTGLTEEGVKQEIEANETLPLFKTIVEYTEIKPILRKVVTF